jgi:hypothetical protein
MMTKLLRVLIDKLRDGAPSPSTWMVSEGLRLPLVALVVVSPFLLSGPIRAVTSLPLPWSLALAVGFVGAVVALLWPCLRAQLRAANAPTGWVAEALGLLLAATAVWALYARDFGGFPNLDGWDGGSHVLIKDQFATEVPALYNGQVAHYAFAWWIEKLFRVDSFRSFTVAFYVAVVATVWIPFGIACTLVREQSGSRRFAHLGGLGVAALGTVAILWLVVLPLLHYNQAAGYYVHVFGLLPLVGLWAADALIRLQRWRVLALGCGFVLLRYTYGLNLADAAIAVAGVLLVEGFAGRWRILQGLIVVGFGVAIAMIIPELRPVFRMWGGMQRFDVDKLLAADVWAVAVGGACLLLAVRPALPLHWLRSPLARAVRLPLFFGLASSVLVGVLRRGPRVQYYYVTKYQVWAVMVLAGVVVVLLAHLATDWLARASWRRLGLWLRTALVVVLLATVPARWNSLFDGYRTSLRERVWHHGPTYKYLHALADVEAIARIKTVLAAEHKQFGGYLTAFFPMFSFMNATLGYHAGRQDFFPPLTEPGRCVFWVTGARDIYRLGPAEKVDALRAAIATPTSPCVEYPVPWKATPQSLCYRCY